MKTGARSLALFVGMTLALAGCGGGGRSMVGGSLPGAASASSKATASITLTIPGASNTASSGLRRTPQTISASTQSITVSVNGGAPQIFNVNSTTCTTGQNGMTCTLVVGAPYGNDGFLVITYSGQNGTGTALNAAAFTLNVTQGGTNTASATAGNLLIVNSSADGSGSGFSCSGGTCTLREAVAEASTTAGVYTAIMFQGVSTITVGSPILIGGSGAQNIILLGPGATVASPGIGAPSASSGVTISGGGTTGIFSVDAGSTFSVVGLTLANGNNTVDNLGGAIENNGGSLTIVNSIFSGNTTGANGSGGAVYDDSGSTSSIVTSTFTNNTTEYGGAYYIEYQSTGASFSHTLFNNNVAFSAVDAYGEGGAIDAYWNLSVDSSTFTGNIAGSQTVGNVEGDGGAILTYYNGASPSITNSTFGGSPAAGNFAGGSDSSSYAYGGAIENDGNYPMVSSGNTFAYNVAKGGFQAEGGAIDDYLGLTSTGDTFSNNVADGTASGSDGDAYGGAVYSEYSPVSFSQDTFSSNAANAGRECDGGALYVYESPVSLAASNVQFSSNTCSANNASIDYAYAYGGAVEVDYGAISFGNVTFSNNTAQATTGGSYYGEAYGGGYEQYGGDGGGCQNACSSARKTPQRVTSAHHRSQANARKTFASTQGQTAKHFARTQAIKTRHASKSKRPAAAAAHLAPALHTASVRRAQSLPANGFDTVTFSGNTANGGPNGGVAYGGGADITGSPTFNAVSFTGNTSTGTGSSAYGVGGAISYTSCNTLSVTATMSGNSAANAGGGIYNECGTLTVTSSTISGNKVTNALYAGDGGGGINNFSTFALTQSLVSGNSVAAQSPLAGMGGGGIMNDAAYGLTIVNSTIVGNTSAIDGGGLEDYAALGGVSLVNTTVYQNAASGKGGNIDIENGGGGDVVIIQNTIVAAGTAPNPADSADIYNGDTLNDLDYNLIQTIPTTSPGQHQCSGIANSNPCTNDITGQALLSPLNSNGGPTQTLADGSSPAKGRIPFSGGLCNAAAGTNVDQRGYTRGAGGVCDIGAYEFSGTAP